MAGSACPTCASLVELATRLAVACLAKRDAPLPAPSCVEEGGTGRIECALLGTFLVFPNLLDEAALLAPADFSSPHRARVFEVLRSFPGRAFDLPLAILEMERRGHQAPPNTSGWAHALSALTDELVWDEERIPDYVMAVREASVLRERAKLGIARGGRNG